MAAHEDRGEGGYRLVAGTVEASRDVAPVDPWAAWWSWREAPGIGRAPYLTWANLVTELLFDPGSLKDSLPRLRRREGAALESFDRSGEARKVLDFAGEWGLRSLGLRPSESSPEEKVVRTAVVDFLDYSEAPIAALRDVYVWPHSPERARAGLLSLNEAFRAAVPKVWLHEGNYRLTWETTSLVDAFVLMLVADLTDVPHRATLCKTCGKVFNPLRMDTGYCLRTNCRAVGHQRLYRQRQEEARALAASGLSVEEIADRVGSRPPTVAGWLGQRAKTALKR